jgi:hypothetical protein
MAPTSPQTARTPCAASKVTMHRSLTLLFVTCLAAAGIASAQTDLASAPVPAPPPPLRLFNDTLPESSGRSITSIKSSSWWEAPARNNEIPRFTIGHTVSFKTPGGLEWSAGLFGRRADPLPLFLSQGVTPDTQRLASNSVTDPAIYRLRWDAKFGVTASLRNSPQLKINAMGEVFLPITGSSEPSPWFRPSRAYRFGLRTGF